MLRKIGIDFRLRRRGKVQWGPPVFNLAAVGPGPGDGKGPAGTLDYSNVLNCNQKKSSRNIFCECALLQGKLLVLALLGFDRAVGSLDRIGLGTSGVQAKSAYRAPFGR